MNPNVYQRHIENQKNHWWFQARKEIIKSFISTNNKKISILDFGSGSGVNIEMLSNFGFVNIYEPHQKTKKYLKKNYADKKKFRIIDSFKDKKFDLILLADVLEHIKDDKKILKLLKKCLKKEGLLLITVPAYNFLFSKKDEKLGHYRRYSKKEIGELFKGFVKLKLTYFNFIFFIPILIIIVFNKMLKRDFIDGVEKSPNPIINTIMYELFRFEKFILKYLKFPFGISIIGLFKKND